MSLLCPVWVWPELLFSPYLLLKVLLPCVRFLQILLPIIVQQRPCPHCQGASFSSAVPSSAVALFSHTGVWPVASTSPTSHSSALPGKAEEESSDRRDSTCSFSCILVEILIFKMENYLTCEMLPIPVSCQNLIHWKLAHWIVDHSMRNFVESWLILTLTSTHFTSSLESRCRWINWQLFWNEA